MAGGPQPLDAMICSKCGTPYILQEDLSLCPMSAEQLQSPSYAHVRALIDDAMVNGAMGNIQL